MTDEDLEQGLILKGLINYYSQAIVDLAGVNRYDTLVNLLSKGNTNISPEENQAFFDALRDTVLASVLSSVVGRAEALQLEFSNLGNA